MYTLRPYQQDTVNKACEFYQSPRDRGIYVLPTGAGKSLIIAEIVKTLGNIPTLVLQPSKELLLQNFQKYETQVGGAKLFSASVNSREVGTVTYATPRSVESYHSKFQEVKLVIIDECHKGTLKDSVIDQFIRKLDSPVVMGLTATPVNLQTEHYGDSRFSNLVFSTSIENPFWESIEHVVQVRELYDLGYLSPLRFTCFDLGLRGASMRGNDFDMSEVSKIGQQSDLLPTVEKLINTSIERGKKKILIFLPTVEEANILSVMIPGLKVVAAKTKKKDRSKIVEDFVNGDLPYIANYATLDTGFDAPQIDLIIDARPTNSFSRYYQAIGRGMRIAEGKQVCDVIDLSGNYQIFGSPENFIYEEHEDEGWGLFVNDRLLTAVPVGFRVHKTHLKYLNRKLDFGKYQGYRIDKIPYNYFKFLVDRRGLQSPWVQDRLGDFLKIIGMV